VKEAGLPVSPICQQALEVAVRRVTEIRETAKLDLTVDDPTARLTRFTAKARTAVRLAISRAREDRVTLVGSEHLLAGILDEGSNLAVQVLRSLEIEPDDVREALDARWPAADIPEDGDTSTAGRHLDPSAAAALKGALNEAISLAHNYVGCEHLLLGLIADEDSAAGQVLRSFGADHRAVRRATLAALGGFVYAKSQGGDPAQQNPADLLRQALAPFSKRLDQLESRMARLTGEQQQAGDEKTGE
jgi:ATP-dependent Clp protease ATP-binding subunit ClpA